MATPFWQAFSNLKTIAIIFINILLIKIIVLLKSINGSTPPALTTAQFLRYIEDKNPAIRYSKTQMEEAAEGQCAVCLSEVKEGESVRKLRCRHLFHKDCLDKWLQQYCKSTCPLCRNKVVADEVVAGYRRSNNNENEIQFNTSNDEFFFLISSLNGNGFPGSW